MPRFSLRIVLEQAAYFKKIDSFLKKIVITVFPRSRDLEGFRGTHVLHWKGIVPVLHYALSVERSQAIWLSILGAIQITMHKADWLPTN